MTNIRIIMTKKDTNIAKLKHGHAKCDINKPSIIPNWSRQARGL